MHSSRKPVWPAQNWLTCHLSWMRGKSKHCKDAHRVSFLLPIFLGRSKKTTDRVVHVLLWNSKNYEHFDLILAGHTKKPQNHKLMGHFQVTFTSFSKWVLVQTFYFWNEIFFHVHCLINQTHFQNSFWNRKKIPTWKWLITTTVCGLVSHIYLIGFFPCYTITFHRYSWCS